jgi:competence protein ComEA
MNMPICTPSHSSRHALLLSLLFVPLLAASAQAQASKAPAPKPASAAQSPAPVATAAGPQGVINLNTATIAELTRLPGIGDSRAAAIIELRTKMQGFKSVEDILRVKGIGRKSFKKLEPMLRLQGSTTLTEARKVSASKGGKD